MPLPSEPTSAWPPKEQSEALRAYRKWAAWWSGDVDSLAKVYAGTVGYSDPVIDGRDRRAMVAVQPRTFHGSPAAHGALKQAKLHVPLAADIATTSADLLFGEPPALVAAVDNADKAAVPRGDGKQSATQDRLDSYMVDGLQAVLVESAEIAAAFGGVYLRVGWDTAIADRPLFDAIPPDAAVPEFRSGALTAVTFHRVLRDMGDGNTWRHLERHEPGKVLHGLFCSGDDKLLGVKKPLKAHPETEAFAALPGGGDVVTTGAEGLAAQYIPNMRPNRRLRGSQLGRSDFDGIESIMDALDEAWSSWMRDLRLGKGRILIPEVYLESAGRGQGALFDAEQEVFQLVNALPGGGDGLAMQNVQFNIRVAEHQQTTAALLEQAVRGAGYAAASFGMQSDGQMATATEVTARASRSFMTRGKKVNYYRPPLARLALAALQIDVAQFRPKGVSAVLPDVEWPDGIAVDPQALAQTLQLLRGAEAASTRTLVEMLHPDWDDTRVGDEVKLIEKEAEADQPPPAFPGTAAAAVAAPGGSKPPGATGRAPVPPAASPAGAAPAPPAPSKAPAAAPPAAAARAAGKPVGGRR